MRIVIDQSRAFARHLDLAAELLEAIGERLYDDGTELDPARITWSYGWSAQAHIDSLEEMASFLIGAPRLRGEDLLDGLYVSLCAAEGGRRVWASIHDEEGPVPRDLLPPEVVEACHRRCTPQAASGPFAEGRRIEICPGLVAVELLLADELPIT